MYCQSTSCVQGVFLSRNMNMCCFMNFSLVLQTVNFMERNMNVVLDKLQKFQVIFHHEQFKKIYVILSFWVSFLVWIVESCGVKPFERTLLRISKAFQTSFKIFLLRKSFQNYGFSKLSTLYETLLLFNTFYFYLPPDCYLRNFSLSYRIQGVNQKIRISAVWSNWEDL